MKIAACKPLLVAICCLALSAIVRADTYSTFQTTRFFSANADYFVEVKPDKHATLYRVQPRTNELVWSRSLPILPERLFVTNDGRRVVVVDHYYGNNRKPSAQVVVFFDEAGKQIAAHELGDVAALSRVLHTTSAAHWYYGALFSPDQTTLTIETVVRQCESCERSEPHEELRFSMADGALLSRADISKKYVEREKRLLHELELVLEEHPPSDERLGYLLVELAGYYEEQKQFSRAKDFYEQAIEVYSRKAGAKSSYATKAIEGRARVLRNISPN